MSKDLLRGLSFLVGLGLLCGLLLHNVNAFTAADIKNNRDVSARQLVAELTGDEIAQSIVLSERFNQQCPDWSLTHETVMGYAGPIELLIYARLPEDAISVRTIAHRETPGIGDFIDQARDDYLISLDESSYASWQALDRVTGATVTSNALKRAIRVVHEQNQLNCVGAIDG